MKSSILFRTDASVANGTGHAMRCLALAQACHDAGISVALASAELPPALVHRWRAEGVTFFPLQPNPAGSVDAVYTARLARQLNSSWIVLDGYHFSPEYQQVLKEHGCQVLHIDDLGQSDDLGQGYYGERAEQHSTDIVLNQNAYASHAMYPRLAPSARLLLGSRYLLLRREFRDCPSHRHPSIPLRASKLLVTLGGSDPDNATQTVLEALRLLDASSIEARIVIGGSNPRAAALAAIASSLPYRVETICDTPTLSDLMEWADFAVAAAGTTAWELAFMGVPFLAMSIAGNQRLVAESLERHHIALNLGYGVDLRPDRLAREIHRLATDYDTRLRMSHAGQDLVDGQGAFRVIQAMGLISLRLCRARNEDAEVLWEWANDPDIRQASFSSAPISWESHQQWFAQKLNDPACAFWVARDAGDRPVAQIRFDCLGTDDMYIGASVAPSWRGKGYGRELIRTGLLQARRAFPGRRAHACIKVENTPSVRAFQSAGFSLAAEEIIQGCRAFHYVAQTAPAHTAMPMPVPVCPELTA